MEKEKMRLHSVDFIKGIAILFVIITHFSWTKEERLQYLFPFWISMAVPVFLIVSGYVWSKSYERCGVKLLKEAYSFSGLAKKVIPYTIPYLIFFISQELGYRQRGIEHNRMQIVKAFVVGGSGPGSYYFPILIQMIFFMPVIYFLVKKYSLKGVFTCGIINFLYECIKSICNMESDSYRLLIFRYTLVISIGCYLALEDDKKRKLFLWLVSGIGVIYIVICQYVGVIPPITNLWTSTSMWAVLYIVPVVAWGIENEKLQNPLLEAIGRASYHIYFVQIFYYSHKNYLCNITDYKILQVMINIVVCVGIGMFFFKIEKPLTDFLLGKIFPKKERRKE